MDQRVLARGLFALTALAVLVGLVVQVEVTAGIRGGHFPGLGARVFNLFCYFTVQSNLIVGVTTALLALRLERTSTVFAVFRLAGVVAILVTFVVFHTVLSGLQELSGKAAFSDFVFHTLVPLLALAGWVAFGPRGLISWRVAALTLLFPLLWGAFTLVRGPLVDFYPYPFVDVRSLGYPRVLVNVVLVGVLFYGLAAAAVALDRRLPGLARRREATAVA